MIKHTIIILLLISIPVISQNNPEPSKKNPLIIYKQIAAHVETLNSAIEDGTDKTPLLNQISALLKQAATMADTGDYKQYLITLSDIILKDNFTSHIPLWMKLSQNKLEIFISRNEKTKKLSVFIFRQHLPEIKKAETIKKKFPELQFSLSGTSSEGLSRTKKDRSNKKKNPKKKKKFTANYPITSSSDRINYEQIKPIMVADLLYPKDSKVFSLVIPLRDEENPDNEYKIFILKNKIKRHFQKKIQPAINQLLSPELKKHVTLDALMTNMIMHRICHYLSSVYISEGEIMVSEALGETYTTIEEIRADMSALGIIRLMEEKKFIENPTANYVTHIMTMAEKISKNEEKYIAHPYMIQLNYFLKQGSISRNINSSKLSVDINKFEINAGELLNETTYIEKQGKLNLATKFIRQYRFGPEQ